MRVFLTLSFCGSLFYCFSSTAHIALTAVHHGVFQDRSQVERLEQELEHQFVRLNDQQAGLTTTDDSAIVELARDCAEHFGECSLNELENIQSSMCLFRQEAACYASE